MDTYWEVISCNVQVTTNTANSKASRVLLSWLTKGQRDLKQHFFVITIMFYLHILVRITFLAFEALKLLKCMSEQNKKKHIWYIPPIHAHFLSFSLFVNAASREQYLLTCQKSNVLITSCLYRHHSAYSALKSTSALSTLAAGILNSAYLSFCLSYSTLFFFFAVLTPKSQLTWCV